MLGRCQDLDTIRMSFSYSKVKVYLNKEGVYALFVSESILNIKKLFLVMQSISNPLIMSISMDVQCEHVCVCRQHVCSSLTLDTPEEVPEIEYIVEFSWSGQQIYTQAVVNPHNSILDLMGTVLHLLGKLSQESSQESLDEDWEGKLMRAGRN